jgi:hypothetical protein
MDTVSLTPLALSSAGWVISVIAILIVAALAWNAFGDAR